MAFIQWLMAHELVMAGLVVGVLDFVFAMLPGVESNGIVHWIYLTAKGFVVPAPKA